MNWDMLSAIGEMSGSAAVLATLIYLALQTRQNTASIQASTRQAILEADLRLLFRIGDDPELVSLRFKPELTDDEKVRLSAYWIAFLRIRENLWRQYQNGVLDEQTWESYRTSIRGVASARFLAWWKNFSVSPIGLDPDFVSMTTEILESTPEQERSQFIEGFD
jgi:hypothetical protein